VWCRWHGGTLAWLAGSITHALEHCTVLKISAIARDKISFERNAFLTPRITWPTLRLFTIYGNRSQQINVIVVREGI
jgi:hypothetical protein